MKLLYKNLLAYGTLSSANGDDSFPVSDLTTRTLEARFQSITMSDTITCEWASNQSISCIALGYHNLTEATYSIKDSSDTEIASGSLEIDYDTNMTYFTEVTTARKLEVSITADTEAYVGGISCGVPLSFGNFNVNPRLDYISNGEAEWLDGGQTTGNWKRSVRRWRGTVSTIQNSERLEYRDMLDEVDVTFPIYADLWEESHDEEYPVHGILQGDGQFTRETSARVYSTTVVVREAR